MTVRRRRPAGAWQDADNAARYHEFTRAFPMYRDTSRDLVERLDLDPAATVLDLCCGTGATTEELLKVLGPKGLVIAVDGSAAMIDVGRAHIDDRRVRWVHARAEDVADAVAEPLDAAVCNSAGWQVDLPKTVAAVRARLQSGGKLAFNIGRRFVMLPFTPEEVAPDRKPGLFDLMSAIAVLDYGVAPTIGGGRPGLTVEGIRSILEGAGYHVSSTGMTEFQWTNELDRAWLQLPVFSVQIPGRTHHDRMAILDAAFERLGDAPPPKSRWLVVVAEAR